MISDQRIEEIRQLIQRRSGGDCSDVPMREACKELLSEIVRRRIEDDVEPFWEQD